MSLWDTLGIFAIVVSLISIGALGLRSVFKFLDWRDGNSDELWNFIALCCGTAASVFFLVSLSSFFTGSSEAAYEAGIILGTLLTIGALGLSFYSILSKWLKAK